MTEEGKTLAEIAEEEVLEAYGSGDGLGHIRALERMTFWLPELRPMELQIPESWEPIIEELHDLFASYIEGYKTPSAFWVGAHPVEQSRSLDALFGLPARSRKPWKYLEPDTAGITAAEKIVDAVHAAKRAGHPIEVPTEYAEDEEQKLTAFDVAALELEKADPPLEMEPRTVQDVYYQAIARARRILGPE